MGSKQTGPERARAVDSGGEDRSRTDLDGFAGRCITALLPRQRIWCTCVTRAVMCRVNKGRVCLPKFWSGRRGSNSRPQPWQGCALPTELLPLGSYYVTTPFARHWSGRRGSNSRPQPWQGCALPTELLPQWTTLYQKLYYIASTTFCCTCCFYL